MTEKVYLQGSSKKRLLVWSDPHITPKAEFSKPTDDGLTEYLHRIQKSFAWLNSLVVHHEPDVVACLGDLFETTGHVDTTSLKVATESVGYLKRVCDDYNASLVFLTGNHDVYSEEHLIHNLQFLRPIVDEVIDEPTLLWDWLYCIPWTNDVKGITIPSKAHLCLTHLDVFGGIMDSGRVCDFGVSPSQFPVFTFNGHQHAPTTLTPQFYNVGSILSRSFRDSGGRMPRGALLAEVDLSDELAKSVNVTRFINPHERPFTTIEIIDDLDAEFWSDTPDGYEQTYVRVKCTAKTREVAELVGCLAAGARIEEVPEDHGQDDKELTVNEEFSPEDNFRRAVEEVMVFDEGGDRERILRYGLEAIAKSKKDIGTQHAAPIEFVRVCIKNFHSLGEADILLRNRGLIAVLGNVGAGKSSIVEAIFWALTGVSLRGYTGDDVIRWGEKSCSVWIELLVNHKSYTIERTRKPTKVRLWAGEEEISCRKSEDTKKLILDLLGRSKSVLQHSVFLTSDLQTRFTALLYPERIKLVEQITGAEIYDDIFKRVSKSYKTVVKELTSTEGKHEQAKSSVEGLSERKQKVVGEIVEATRNQKLSMGRFKKDLNTAVDQREMLKVEIQQVEKLITSCGTEIEQIKAKVAKASKVAMVTETKIERVDRERELLGKRLRDIRKEIELGQCPTCGQVIHDGAPIRDRAEDMRTELRQLVDLRSVLWHELETAKEEIATHQLWLSEADDPEELKSVIRGKERALLQVEKTINGLKMDLQKQRASLDGLKAASVEITEQLDSANQAVDDLQTEIGQHIREVYAWEWLINAFSTKGIRAKVLSTVTLPYLNSRIERHSERLGMPCKLTNKTETKGGKVEDKLDIVLAGERTYKGCSRGQRREVDLAIQKAFNDLATKTGGFINLLVCDEIIDPLDDASTQAFADLLRESGQTVLLMTHKQFAETLADDKMQLVLQDGETTIY
jgi:DNA repair exonuclease SbcCD ATPase subunit/DNA repair exonuclease SbcCD nuclease subunit